MHKVIKEQREQAARAVEAGERVHFPAWDEMLAVAELLAARRYPYAVEQDVIAGGYWLSPSPWERALPAVETAAKIELRAGAALHALLDAVRGGSVHTLRIHQTGDTVKFKVNEGMWSPPYPRER